MAAELGVTPTQLKTWRLELGIGSFVDEHRSDEWLGDDAGGDVEVRPQGHGDPGDRICHVGEGNAWDGEFRQVLEEQFLKAPPEDGRPAEEVLERVSRNVLPYAARLDHPRFFGFIPSSPTWPGVLADFLAAGFNINSCTWLVASGTSQLELVVTDWIRRWIGYPENAGGGR